MKVYRIQDFTKPYEVRSQWRKEIILIFTKGYIEYIESLNITALWGVSSKVETPYLLTITKALEYIEENDTHTSINNRTCQDCLSRLNVDRQS